MKNDDVALNGAFWTHKKSGVQIRYKKWNPDSLKEIVRFVHEGHPVFAVTIWTFLHMQCGWNDDTMPTFNLFRVHLKCFSISRLFSSQNKSVNASKIANYVRKGWKLMTWVWIVHLNAKKVQSCTKLLKYWNSFVTDEFSSETLILPKRLSSLYTKCIQFLP